MVASVQAVVQDDYFDKSDEGIVNISDIIIPNETVTCDFWGNRIKKVPANYFIALPRLEILNIERNRISEIEPFAFYPVPSVKQIYLYGNKLEILSRNMFSGLIKLERLRIPSNFIHTIESGTFANLTSIKQIYLQRNKLHTIKMEIFVPSNYNFALELRVHENLVQCTKCMCWLMEAEKWLTMVYPKKPFCSGPNHLAGKPWSSLCREELGCQTIGKTNYYKLYTTYIFMLFSKILVHSYH